MVRTHPSTPDERAQLAATMLAHRGEYGLITQFSRVYRVSRPTLYAWRSQAERALQAAFSPPCAGTTTIPQLQRQVLALWIAR